MGKLKNFLKANIVRVAVVMIALLAAICACVITTKSLEMRKSSDRLQKYSIEDGGQITSHSEENGKGENGGDGTSSSNGEDGNVDENEKKGKVTVKYQDEKGNQVASPVTKEGKIGSTYVVKRADVANYTRTGDEPINRAGVYGEEEIEVVFQYKDVGSEVSKKIEQKDEHGLGNNAINIMFNNTRTPRDYDILIKTKDEKGTSLDGAEFSIKKDDKEINKGTVKNGEFFAGRIAIAEEGSINYEITENKSTRKYKNIENPINLGLTSTWDENKKMFSIATNNGNQGSTQQGVKITIEQGQEADVQGIDEYRIRDQIIIEVTNERIKDSYEVEINNKSGDNNIEGTKFKVTSEDAVLKDQTPEGEGQGSGSKVFSKEDKVENGILKVGTFEISDEDEDNFTIFETETNDLYKPAIKDEKGIKVKVKKSFKDEKQVYEITTEGPEQKNIKVTVENKKVTINIDSEENKYDLAIKKFVSAVNGNEVKDREPVVTYSEDNKPIYTQSKDWIKVANEQKVTYTLRMYNETDTLAKGKRIIEYLPKGLNYLPDNDTNKTYEWKLYYIDENESNKLVEITKSNSEEIKNNDKQIVVATDYLVNKEIAAFNKNTEDNKISYQDVKIVLQVDEDVVKDKDIKERLIENEAKIQENPHDDFPANDTDKEKVYVKYFDLKITKYIDSIHVVNHAEDKTYNIGKNKKEETKIEVLRSQINKTKFTVKYGIEITNNGEIPGTATKILDSFPDDFTLVENNNNWKMQDIEQEETQNEKIKQAISEQLNGISIAPKNAQTVYVTFEWDLKEDKTHKKSNTAKINEYKNENNAEDLIPDQEDNDDFTVEIVEDKYDLAIKKFVSKVGEEETSSRAPIAKVQDGKVIYEQNSNKVQVANSQLVTYTIRLYNESEALAEGKRVIENIPDGLKFVKDNKTNTDNEWKLYKKDDKGKLVEAKDGEQATIVATDKLVKQEIPARKDGKVSFADVQVVFEVDETPLNAKETTDQRIIVNKAEIEKSVNDDNQNNDTDEETIYVKYFDLKIAEYIESIHVKNRAVDKKYELGKDKKGELTKIKVLRSQINKTKITVKYGIEITNIGEIDGKATEILDNFPEDFKLKNTDNWKEQNGEENNTQGEKIKQAISDQLKNTTIKPNEKQTINVTFEWDVNEDRTQTKRNTVKIKKSENQYNAKDLTPDQEDHDEFTVEIVEDKYDLAIKKFVSAIDGVKTTNREPKVTIGENGKVKYEQNGEPMQVANSQKVTYTIRLYNESEALAEGKKVIEHIPAGLKFLKEDKTNTENQWQLYYKNAQGELVETEDDKQATIVATDKLVKQEIPARKDGNVNYLDVQVVFEVDETPLQTKTTIDQRKVINKAEIERNVNDDNTENDSSEETVFVKVFDLKLTKFIKKIRVKNETTDDVRKVGRDYNGENIKIAVGRDQADETTITVKYGLDITNVGQIPGKVTKLIDDLPDDFNLAKGLAENLNSVNNYGWKQALKQATTEQMKDTVIEPGKTITIYIKVKYRPTEENVGLKLNKAKIDTYTNDFNAKDPTPDNEDDAGLTVELTDENPKQYDLALRKFISKIDDGDDETEARRPRISLNESGNVVYTKQGEAKQVAHSQKITYTLRMYNESNVTAKGKRIIEYIPDGLEFLPDDPTNVQNQWKLYKKGEGGVLIPVEDVKEATLVATDILVNEKINSFDKTVPGSISYKDVQVVFQVNEKDLTGTKLEDRKIENTALIESNPNDNNTKNDKDTEIAFVKVFDLKLTTFIQSIKVVNDETNEENTYTLEQKSQEKVAKVLKTQINNTTITVKYGLIIKNVGDIEGEATEIVDLMPAKFKVADIDNNWKTEERESKNVAVTEQLKDKTLKPQEETTINVTLEYKVNEEDEQEKDNTANITKYLNPYNAEDPTPDEDNNDKFKVEIINDKYDLAIKKFVSAIDEVETKNREPKVIKIGDGKVKYEQSNEWEKVANSQKVTYTLRMYNETNVNGKGKTIIEHIPDGLVYLPENETNKEYKWKLCKEENGKLTEVEDASEANVITTDCLVATEIKAFDEEEMDTPDYKDVKVVFEVDESKVKSEDRTVKNTVLIKKNLNDDNPQNDEDTETVYVKVFDLKLTKFIESIKVKNDETDEETKYTVEQRKEEKTAKVLKTQIDRTTITVRYGLVIENIGDIEGTVKEITDNIPEDFQLVGNENNADGNWKTEERNALNLAITNQLQNQTLQPKDKTTIYITFQWKLNKEDLKERKNTANITLYENKYNAKDPTPDEDNDDEFTIEIINDEYDLAIKKFVSAIDGVETTSREPKVTITEDKKVQYEQSKDWEEVANSQEVTYTLRMYNETNVKGKGKTIIEHIPDGLVFLPENKTNKDYQWQLFKKGADGTLTPTQDASEANVITTDYLVKTEIEAFDPDQMVTPDYKDVKVVFQVDESKITSEDRIIENNVSIKENLNDDNPKNDEDTEIVYVKVFDLKLTKFVDTIKIENGEGTTEETYGLDKRDTEKVIKVLKTQVDKTTLTIKYGIKIENIGEIPGKATEILDNIPANFTLIDGDEANWEEQQKEAMNVAITTQLKDKTLEPKESTTIYVTFKWKLSEDKVGERINSANITAYENPYDADDPTDDEDNDDKIIVEIENDKYDLTIKKFVSEIDGVATTNREPKVSKTEDGKVKYEQSEDWEKVANSQEVTYTLRMYNETNVKGKGKKIIEHIPEGLVFLPDNETNKEYAWEFYKQGKNGNLTAVTSISEANVIVTDYLVNEEIGAFDPETMEAPVYKEVKVVFEVDEDKITTKDRTITNKVSIQRNPNDDNPDNDESTETVYVKYFDLDITKEISSVQLRDDEKQEVTEVDISASRSGDAVKVEVSNDKVNETTLIVTYGLTVKNIGEIEGYATELKDFIPADFELTSAENWSMQDENMLTEQLAETLLQPGESKTIYITFEWKLSEDNVGSRINKAKITEYKNPYDAEDPTENNEDEDELIVEIKIVKYDLAMKKFVSEIDGEIVEGREPVAVIENGKIEYRQSKEVKQVANEQEIKYTLRTYNESNVTGKGKRIIEYIPDGLVFLPENEVNVEYGWKYYKEDQYGHLIETQRLSEATVVATDYLVKKEIEGFNIEEEGETPNYIDIYVVFKVDESKVTSEDRIVENKVKLEKNDNDDNPKNDETTEKVYVKYFDLDVEKYIKEVKVKNNIKETIKEVGQIQKGQLVKVDIAKNDVENTTLTVTYVLKVKNIGEIAGYATELVDYIPADFKLVEDGIWKVRDNEAVTTKLENKLLEPGESTEIEITFDWKLTSDNIGSRINEGKITKYENEYNAKDPTEDNNDTEEMLVTVRTGSVWVFIVIAVLVGLWMIVGILYLLKNRKSSDEEDEE